MKRLCSYLGGFLIVILMFPLLVLADVGAPELGDYDVIISNKDGASLYDYNYNVIDKIPYDTKITVNFEYTRDGVLYGTINYHGQTGDIRLSDVKIYDEEIDLDDYLKLDIPAELYVFDDDDAYLYKGPSTVYGRVDKEVRIPQGEIVSYEYYNDAWVYVEYDGVKGWLLNYSFGDIYSDLSNSVAQVAGEKNRVYVIDNVKTLLKNPKNTDDTIDVDIPAGTELEYKYYYNLPKSGYAYVEYEDQEGWIYVSPSSFGEDSSSAVIEDECSTLIVVSEEAYIYEEETNLDSKTDKTIPYGEEVTVIFSFVKDNYTWYYVSYDGENYWLAEDSDYENNSLYVGNYGYIQTYEINKGIEIYEYPNKDSKIIGTINKDGEVVDTYYTFVDNNYEYSDDYYSWTYIEYDGVKGWVLTTTLGDLKENKELCKTTIKTEENEETEKDKEDKSSNSLSPKVIVAIAIGGAVVLALVVIVIIKLVNRNKNKEML